jgi:hypothetical protein
LAVSYKTIHTSKSSNQNTIFIEYDILIGCFSNTSKKTPTQKVLLCTHTTKSPNRNTVFIEYGILIGCFLNTSKKTQSWWSDQVHLQSFILDHGEDT